MAQRIPDRFPRFLWRQPSADTVTVGSGKRRWPTQLHSAAIAFIYSEPIYSALRVLFAFLAGQAIGHIDAVAPRRGAGSLCRGEISRSMAAFADGCSGAS